MSKKVYIVFILILCYQNLVWSQKLDRVERTLVDVKIIALQNKSITITRERLITAIVIISEIEGTFYLNNEDQSIPLDPDAEAYSYFISISAPTKEINIRTTISTPFQVFTIHTGDVPSPISGMRMEGLSDCVQPINYIPQSEWRTGLAAPNYSRSFHEVKHHIIHHSAGSNSNQNYTQVVRDIYVYHTEINGWSDIGYNYLISQDGTIYAGRDPGNGSQNDVRGAHFCAKNSGTMGICLLGNYELVEPPIIALNSLSELLSYNFIRLELNPFDEYVHFSEMLGTIAGHSDGCATLCPGSNLYDKLEKIRLNVSKDIDSCSSITQLLTFSFDTSKVTVGKSINLINESTGYDKYSWLTYGGVLSTSPFRNQNESQVTYFYPGRYDIGLVGVKGNKKDSVVYKGRILVSYFEKLPVVFPNPITGANQLNIDFPDESYSVNLLNVSGQVFESWQNSPRNLIIPPLRPGVYLIEVRTPSKQIIKRILVN